MRNLARVAAFCALAAPACAHKKPEFVFLPPPDRGDCILPVLQDHKENEPYKFYVDDACVARKKRELEQKQRAHMEDQVAKFVELLIEAGRVEKTMPDGTKILMLDQGKISVVFALLAEVSPELRDAAVETLEMKGYHLPRLAVVTPGRMCVSKPSGVLMPDGTPVMTLNCKTLQKPEKAAPVVAPAPKK